MPDTSELDGRTLVQLLRESNQHIGSEVIEVAAQRLDRMTAENIFANIEHGDTEHRAWLQEALIAIEQGRPVPASRGGNTP